MNTWGVAVLELGSHPDHNKGPNHAHCACPMTHPIDHFRAPPQRLEIEKNLQNDGRLVALW